MSLICLCSSSSPVTSSVGKLSHNDKQEVDGGGSAGGSSANPGEATPVIDNTPPLTPDSSMSTLSNSPRGSVTFLYCSCSLSHFQTSFLNFYM